MESNELNGRQSPASKATRKSKSEEGNKVDIPAVSLGGTPGRERLPLQPHPGVAALRGRRPLDVTAQVMPPVALKIVEIIFHINGDTANLEKIILYSAWPGLRRFPGSCLDYNTWIEVTIQRVCQGAPGWHGIASN